MAAPPSTTVNSLSGQWTLNKTLSDDFSPILALQGVNILIRKAAGAASVQLKIVQLDDLHITLVSTAGGGRIPGKKEEYTHDFVWRSEKDMMFGEMQIRSRWITVDEARSKGVVREADECWLEGGAEGSGELVYGEAKKEGKWEAAHLWGFEIVDGQRRHVRWVRVRNMKGEELRARLVYDFVSL